MVLVSCMVKLFRNTIPGLKNLSTFQASFRRAFFSPTSFTSSSNCSSRSPSMLSYNAGGQKKRKKRSGKILSVFFKADNRYICSMKTLTLNLADSVANKFNSLSLQEKGKVEKVLANVLEEMFRQKAVDRLFDIMSDASAQAKKNGLTIAKLAEIMEWDEQTVKNLFGEEAVRNEQ